MGFAIDLADCCFESFDWRVLAARLSLVDEAMRVCGVNDMENKRWFTSAMLTKNPADCLEVIMTFESECKSGEHKGLKKPAAELTRRLKALPQAP